MPNGLTGFLEPEGRIYGKTGELYHSLTSVYFKQYSDMLNVGWVCIAGEFVPTPTPTPTPTETPTPTPTPTETPTPTPTTSGPTPTPTIQLYNLSVIAESEGSAFAFGSGNYPMGAVVSISASFDANLGYSFVSWSNNVEVLQDGPFTCKNYAVIPNYSVTLTAKSTSTCLLLQDDSFILLQSNDKIII